MKPVLFIIVPCYNEQEVLPITAPRFLAKLTMLRALGKISDEMFLAAFQENTIYRLIRSKKIEHYKVGVQIRISAAELERLKVPAERDENDAT